MGGNFGGYNWESEHDWLAHIFQDKMSVGSPSDSL